MRLATLTISAAPGVRCARRLFASPFFRHCDVAHSVCFHPHPHPAGTSAWQHVHPPPEDSHRGCTSADRSHAACAGPPDKCPSAAARSRHRQGWQQPSDPRWQHDAGRTQVGPGSWTADMILHQHCLTCYINNLLFVGTLLAGDWSVQTLAQRVRFWPLYCLLVCAPAVPTCVQAGCV